MTWGGRDLEVRYGHDVVLRDVTVETAPGTIVAIVGGDGAGKTTLLRALAGAVAPAVGHVERPSRTRIGYASALGGVYVELSVDENIAFAAAVYGVAGRSAWIDELLDQAGLAAARRRLAGQLSGGMRQKLAVVCALVHRPDLVVLDEPTTGVDPVSRAELWRLLTRAAIEGAAVVCSTTYLDEAERAGMVVVLDDGEALLQGSPDELIAAMPGTVTASPTRPPGPRVWRRGRRWQAWSPDGDVPAGAVMVAHDLDDAVVVALLAREAQPA